MTKYRVKPGYTYGAYGTFREGDIVELPSEDAAPFLDKLELVPDPVAPRPVPVPESVPPPLSPSLPAEQAPAPVEAPPAPAKPEPVAKSTAPVVPSAPVEASHKGAAQTKG